MIIPSKYINIDEVMHIKRIYNQNNRVSESGGTGQLNSPASLTVYDVRPGQDITTYDAFKKLSRNWSYLCIIMSLTGLFFVISGIQYWASHYLQNALGVSHANTFKYFMGTCISSPCLGAILSGYVSK